MKSLQGKTAVITGGASGIGYAMAERFSKEGMKVMLADIERKALDAAILKLESSGAQVAGVVTDVSDLESMRNLATATLDTFGHVDVLCNNAGVETGGTFSKVSHQAWQWVMDVNFYGVLNGCRIFLPLLEKREEGHIVNTASVAAFASGTITMAPYCASKMAVLGLSESLDIELRSTDSTVNVSLLAPGPVKTNMTRSERNIPSNVPLPSEPIRMATMEQLSQLTTETGLEPSAIADMVVQAIYNREFFILPHPHLALAGVHRRLAWMETGVAPTSRRVGQ